MISKEKKCLRGEIWYCDLGEGYASEQGGLRPVLVVQNDVGNKFSTTTIVACITSATKNNLPTHVEINEILPKTSTVMCEQVRTIEKSRLIDRVGTLSKRTMNKVNKAMVVSIFNTREVY